MLKEKFCSLISLYTQDKVLQEELWKEIETNYSDSGRHYHNLHHLENLLIELDECKPHIKNETTVLFALFYHDIIYNVNKKDNEEQSALLAAQRMQQLHCNSKLIEEVKEMILATKTHHVSDNNDINLFTDADLSILGKDISVYFDYGKQIRKEYKIYPDLLYKPGRRKVLEQFLDMEHIFKTEIFRNKYEAAARENIKEELTAL